MKFEGRVKGDLILVVVLLIMGLGILAYSQVVLPWQSRGSRVLVEIDGKVVRELALDSDLQALRFETDHGYNTVEIKDGNVRVAEADCPDLLCVHTGWRKHVGQVIICLPHHLVVRVVGDQATPADLDSFTY